MGKEIDLLKNYPKTKRDLNLRLEEKTEEVRSVARKFGKEFFDGERRYGYGGFTYNPRFWGPVIPTFLEYWKLENGNNLLDVGCAKGFMLYDFFQILPELNLYGIDISTYAVENCISEVKKNVRVANANNLPYQDNFFDAVISINTIHNLEIDECAKAIREIERVSKGKSFITVDAYNNDEEKKRMFAWNLTAKTIMSVEDWKKFFKSNGYSGDYYWFIP
tara:strand:- start:5024 stop:5683 length:660 start_codon:yes stop_codon:yes gene_type:complete